MTKRTDIHRPGAIVPRDYRYVFSYSLAGADALMDPPLNIELYMALRDNHENKWASHGGLGKCTVCGACYRHGDVWQHVPSGVYINIGHDCAEKYELIADRDDWSAALEAQKTRRKAMIQAKINEEKRERFLARHPGLKEALKTDHHISADLAHKFWRLCELSEKQVELAFKLQKQVAEAAERKAKEVEEVKIPAPTGKVTVRGRVVARKTQESAYGIAHKMIVKVTTEAGVWLVYVSEPGEAFGLYNALPIADRKGDFHEMFRGAEVEFSATLQQGKEPHFAFGKRPTKFKLLSWGK